MSTAAFILKAAEFGLTLKQAAELAATLETSPPAAPTALEKRRAYDRERKRAKANSTGIPPENAEREHATVPRNSTGISTGIPPESAPLARGLDKPLTVVVSGTDGGDGGGDAGAREKPQPSDDWPAGDAKTHADLLVQFAASPWLDPQRSPGLVTTTGRVNAWRRCGASWLHDVVPVVQGACARQRQRVNGWQFFDAAISRSIADNQRALEIPEAAPRPSGPDPPRRLTLADQVADEHRRARDLALTTLKARSNG